MTCRSCGQETQVGFFCHACDSYLADPAVGVKAGLSRRGIAQILDALGAWVVFFVLISMSAALARDLSGFLITFLLAMVVYAGFEIVALAKGETLGKWMVGIRVVDKRNGGNPGFARMVVRETIGKFMSGVVLGIGYLSAIWDAGNQAWHDRIAGTLVIRRQHSAEARHNGAAPGSDRLKGGGPTASGSVMPRTPERAAVTAGGVAVSDETAAAGVTASPRYCRNCGAALRPGSKFCSSCGETVSVRAS